MRLENWARWSAQRDSGGLGFPKQSAFVKLAAHGTRAEAIIPTDSIEASLTDDAVQALRLSHSHLHLTLCCIYLRGLGVKATSRRLGKHESTVYANLASVDRLLSNWFAEREQRLRGGFTA